jgi:LmbE family N-acetylglucosaminyl deacetylase
MSLQAKGAEPRADFSRRFSGNGKNSSTRVVLLAAHPDDETIGASSLLARFPRLTLVYLTDGAPRDRGFWSPDARGSRANYAQMRRIEAEQAVAHAGVVPNQIVWLGGVDQEAILESAKLMLKFAEILQRHQPEIVITHPYEGGHPDHDAAALVAGMALTSALSHTLLVEMTSYHALSGCCVTGEFLDADTEETACELTAEDALRKRRMMDAHVSQRAVLADFKVDCERFRPAPAYDFTKPPHEGRLWYECMEWPMTGARWRSIAEAAIREMQECDAAHCT